MQWLSFTKVETAEYQSFNRVEDREEVQETGNTLYRPGRGWKRSVRSPQLLKNTREKLRRSPRLKNTTEKLRRSCRTLATAAGVSKSTMHQVLRDDLMVKPFKTLHRQELTANHVAMRAQIQGNPPGGVPTARCRNSYSRTRRNSTSSSW